MTWVALATRFRVDLPREWHSLVPGQVEGGGKPVLSSEQCFSFRFLPFLRLLQAFEFCVFTLVGGMLFKVSGLFYF